MPNFVPVTKTEFSDKHWQRKADYSFAAKDAICPLVAQELHKAVLCLPIAFAYINEKPTFVAVQGIKAGRNVLVGKNGKWIGKYIPAAYRGYPFLLANTEEGKQVLCFDQDSGLLSPEGEEGFFTENGEITEAIKGLMDFLTQMHTDRLRTENICDLLHRKKLIQPWPIKLKGEEGEIPVEGLYRIDEAALNAMDKDDFDLIRHAGALPLIYCQLLSMQHLPDLVRLTVKLEQKSAPAQQSAGTTQDYLKELFGEDGESFTL